MTVSDSEQETDAPGCYRHPKRETYVRCVRCDRYACADCLRDAPVGHQCVECVREGNKSVRQARTVFGGQVTATPVVTYALIAVTIIAYLGELAWPAAVDRFSTLGMGLMHDQTGDLYAGGHYFGSPPPGFSDVGIAAGEWYRLITGAFLHLQPTDGLFGILHIVFNMYWLWQLGRAAEHMLGPVRFLALYLISALGGSTLIYLVSPDLPAVGASGAIFGLAAAYYLFCRRLGIDMAEPNRLIMFFLIWMVISAGISSWEGHLGGLLTGGTMALAYAYAPVRLRLPVQATASVVVPVLLVALVVLKTSDITGGL